MSKDKKQAFINLKETCKAMETYMCYMKIHLKFIKEMIKVLEEDGK